MKKWLIYIAGSVLLFFIIIEIIFQVLKYQEEHSTEIVTLEFNITQNLETYKKSYGGKLPQFAIWLEDTLKHKIKTVKVSHKTGTVTWDRIKENSIVLPYWSSRHIIETGEVPPKKTDDSDLDAVTGATSKFIAMFSKFIPAIGVWMDNTIMETPMTDVFNVQIKVWKNSQWDYYVEVNCAGDFNDAFPLVFESGETDELGNGQPSLIYKGTIEAVEGLLSQAALIGRSDQLQPIDTINTDVSLITTAKTLFTNIQVYCK